MRSSSRSLLLPLWLTLGVLVWAPALVSAIKAEREPTPMVFATVVANPLQERKAAILVDSIRRFGGEYAKASIFVAVDNPDRLPCPNLETRNVRLLALQADPIARNYPFAKKVFAAAQVERQLGPGTHTLVWLDPESMILAPPVELDLGARAKVALRPVFFLNQVGQPVDQPVDAFWSRIYQIGNIDPARVPAVKAELDPQTIRFYINCEIIAYRPPLGICQRWARLFTELVKDEAYQKANCVDPLHQIFLHQAVLSAIVLQQTGAADRRWLSVACGYPLHILDRVPESRRLPKLSQATAVIYEDFFEKSPDWRTKLTVDPPLGGFLSEAHDRLLKIADRIWREEGASNTYWVTTPEGSVVIDPGGALGPASRLQELNRGNPVRAVLLTHGHEDHRGGIAQWTGGRDIPVIAQREMVEYIRYRDRLADFFRARDAAHSGAPVKPRSDQPTATPVEATVLFRDEHTYRQGDLTFQFFHTGGETPDTSLLWIPELKAAFLGDNFYSSFPMLYTPRGTKPRWALDYVGALDRALRLEPELLLPGHGEPVVGRSFVRTRLAEYRDAIQEVHDAVVKGMNQGKDVFTLMREVKLPADSPVGQFYGRVSWSVRGIYEGYAGWFDGNPANLYDRPAVSVFPDLVRLAGGVGPVIGRARERLEAGDPLAALHLADAALTAEPEDREARQLRLEILKLLQGRTRNLAESNWLGFAIKQSEAGVATAGSER